VPDTYSTFDFPDPCQILGRREVTTVAPQALFFMNGRMVSRAADATAELLAQQSLPDDAARVAWLYRRLFARTATTDEIRDAVDFLNQASSQDRWSLLVQACFCSADFRYLR
jgi:beta-phosphoglucomutase-like phosphatase (HAD superfamily)